ncbi:hypothetical protein KCP73_03040 [Salmonella enterica subsp. enterica]|nr:hypothetical protein KCP73_03040 [Salmonella enterica subsp. enterica]
MSRCRLTVEGMYRARYADWPPTTGRKWRSGIRIASDNWIVAMFCPSVA